MKHFLFSVLFLLTVFTGSASGLKVSQPVVYFEQDQPYAVFNLSWDHAWRNDRNYDAAWLFFKTLPGNGGYRHIRVADGNHEVLTDFSSAGLDFEVASNRAGLFVFPKNKFRGNVKVTLKIQLHAADFEGVNTRNALLVAYGTEMVYIPGGPFELGDPNEEALQFGSFYRPDANGAFAGLPKITAEDQTIKVAKDGDLYYQAKKGYEGDQQGTIPASYPKGYAAFYMMKYEITEGQYVDFLYSLDTSGISERLVYQAKHYEALGGTIKKEKGKYITPFRDKPCRFMSWDDAMAYADWTGLRPMTEFEFAKAARGTDRALPIGFPWGKEHKAKVQRLPNKDGVLEMINEWTEEKLSDENRVYFAASFYWVMDLAGSLWERLITIGHPNGRQFTGTHGDGVLSQNAANEQWPIGARDSGGIGFRGGGFYGYWRSYHEYNPFSPIAFRPYGGWHGGIRSEAYGTRLVRTSSQN